MVQDSRIHSPGPASFIPHRKEAGTLPPASTSLAVEASARRILGRSADHRASKLVRRLGVWPQPLRRDRIAGPPVTLVFDSCQRSRCKALFDPGLERPADIVVRVGAKRWSDPCLAE